MNIFDKLDPPIDYHGQELATKLFYVIIYFGYAFSLAVGIVLSDLKYTLYLGVLTLALSIIVVVPPWRFYRKNPLKFVKEKKD